MGMINQLMAPIRSIVRFPLFQFAVVVFLILWLQAGDEASMRGYIFNGIDRLVETTVSMAAAVFTVKSFTRTWLTSGFWIAYVYIACLLILSLARFTIGLAADFAGRRNIFWLRNSIARERGIVAYRAWVPFERIRPADIPQPVWEEAYAWPANNRPPYRPLAERIARGALGYAVAIVVVLGLLQVFTSFPVLTWLSHLI
ncbi:MAG TPA: hypothetical protein VIJ78_09670 [Pseudolabrys sp.]